ncbi:MAG: hypothetical protein Q9163_000919 [Psora crenata]
MADADGDSEMGNVSSHSTDSEDAMFPSANADPATENSNNPTAPLSSPLSSQQPQNGDVDAMETTGGEQDSGKMVPKGEFGMNAQNGYVPGASWDNKEARDEWQKAWVMLEDKGFSLSRL